MTTERTPRSRIPDPSGRSPRRTRPASPRTVPPTPSPSTAVLAQEPGAHLADVAHEIRTPTAIALGLVSRLSQNQGLLPEVRRDVDRIAANLRVIDTHVRSLLSGARIEVLDDRPVEFQDLATCFRKTAQDFASLADDEGVRLAIEAPLQLEAAVAPGHLAIVLSNLLVNAIRSTPRHGVVRCTLSLDRELRIAVADSGPGIPPGDRQRVLERFTSPDGHGGRGDRTTRLGLGLEIVERITRAYGGRVEIGDAPEGGALVVVALRERPTGGKADGGRRDSSPPVLRMANATAPLGAAHGPPLIVVLSDDDRGATLVAALTRDRAREAICVERDDVTLGCGAPDAIVLAPDHLDDAVELVAHARDHADHADVPIVALAPTRNVICRLDLLRLGVDEVVDPNLSDEELRGRVDRQIARCRRDAQRRTDAARFRRAFHDAATGMGIATVGGRWQAVNPALGAITGFSEAQLLQRRLDDLDHPSERGEERAPLDELLAGRTRGFQIDKRWRTAIGASIWVRLSISAERDAQGVASGLIVQVDDVTDRRTREGQLERRAGHDGLTGLLGRRGFEIELRHRIVIARESGPHGALIVFDLDDLEGLNARYGLPASDHALLHVSWVLQDALRRADIVARATNGSPGPPALVGRVGGNQFAVLLAARTPRAVDAVARVLLAAIRDHPLRIGEAVVPLTACFGCTTIDGSLPAAQIVRAAIAEARGKKPERPAP